ncbi:MAG: DNA internalization-related competence protein ComEC/Rec2, partial [Nitrospinae bacterium]|nr:DNA internalization-related competence protein ComEC/Rec2 [Nitrospinota bacterium]
MLKKDIQENLSLLFLFAAITGISPAYWFIIHSEAYLFFTALFCIILYYLFFVVQDKKKALVFFLIALFFSFLTLYLYLPSSNSITSYFENNNLKGTRIDIKGSVENVTKLPGLSKTIIELEFVRKKGEENYSKTGGIIKANIYDKSAVIRAGDEIEAVNVELREISSYNNPGSFDYKRYQNLKGIYFYTNISPKKYTISQGNDRDFFSSLQELREFITERISQEANGQLISAILLGYKFDIDNKTRDIFSEAGIAHLFAVSGLHVGFIAIAFFLFFKVLYGVITRAFFMEAFLSGFFERLAAFSTIFPLLCYATLVGEKSSSIRAAVMIITYLIIFSAGYRRALFNSINIAAFILLIYNPFFLYDIGFQLSFCAVYAIIAGFYIAKTVYKLQIDFTPNVLNSIRNYFLIVFFTSLFAFAGTFLLVLHYFQLISFVGIFINLLAIPLATLIVPIAFLGMLFLFVSETVAHLFFAVSGTLLNFLKEVASFAVEIPYSHLYFFSPDPFVILFMYGAIIFFALYFRETMSFSKTFQKGFLYFAILLLIMLVAPKKYQPTTTIVFFDIGQGEAIFIKTETGSTILVDAGMRYQFEHFQGEKKTLRDGLDMGRIVIAPFLRQQSINGLTKIVSTHHHSDHSGGMKYIAEKFKVGTFFVSPYYHDSREYQELFPILRNKHIPVEEVIGGDYIYKGENTQIKVIYPEWELENPDRNPEDNKEVNNLSLVLEVKSYGKTFLLTSDIEKEAELTILEKYKEDIDVLKSAHHGSRSSNIPAFIKNLKPEIAVISVGRYNKFHFPSQTVLKTFEENKVKVLRTDQLGC